jgi:hypothetical protein
MISSTLDWISWSVIRLMWPFLTRLSKICRGLLLIQGSEVSDMQLQIRTRESASIPNRVEDGQEPRLEGVLEHGAGEQSPGRLAGLQLPSAIWTLCVRMLNMSQEWEAW